MTTRQYAIWVLESCEMPCTLKGYKFLVDAIELAHNNDDCYDNIVKVLYPRIAELHCTTAWAVERAIRNAVSRSKSKHTNAGFIKSAVWFIRQLEKPSQ